MNDFGFVRFLVVVEVTDSLDGSMVVCVLLVVPGPLVVVVVGAFGFVVVAP